MNMLFATSNPNKVKELAKILAPYDIQLLGLSDFDLKGDCPESGDSFLENAMQKAQHYFKKASIPVFADDSGLEVDALNGAPGIHSARFGGLPNHQQKCRYLLDLVKDVEGPYRTARFTCAAVYLDDAGFQSCQESVEGFIGPEPKGDGGFGYDPIFWLSLEGQSMAELPMDKKNEISHRGKAFRGLVSQLFGTDGVKKAEKGRKENP